MLLLVAVAVSTTACSRPRVLVLGLDGADWDVIDPLMEGGYLPTITGLVRSGVRADLDCRPANPAYPCYCPPVWMTVATGQPFSEHRIAHGSQRADERRAKAIWTVLAERSSGPFAADGSSTLIAWHNIWPPESAPRYVVTRAALRFASTRVFDRIEPPPSPMLADPALFTHPPGLLEELGVLPHEGERRPAWGPLAMDRIATTMLDRIEARGGSTLTMMILHGIDKDAHIGWDRIQPRPDDPVDAEAVLELARAWEGPVFAENRQSTGDPVGPLLEADAWLGRHLETAGYDYVVLASDHGMTRNPEPGNPGAHGRGLPAAHTGIFALSGPGVVAGLDLGRRSVLHVAPTLAYVLELPVAEDLPGVVMRRMFTPAHLEEHEVATVASWGD